MGVLRKKSLVSVRYGYYYFFFGNTHSLAHKVCFSDLTFYITKNNLVMSISDQHHNHNVEDKLEKIFNYKFNFFSAYRTFFLVFLESLSTPNATYLMACLAMHNTCISRLCQAKHTHLWRESFTSMLFYISQNFIIARFAPLSGTNFTKF